MHTLFVESMMCVFVLDYFWRRCLSRSTSYLYHQQETSQLTVLFPQREATHLLRGFRAP